ncbi:MAG TPA: hypothetical protein VHO48_12245 [Anaerolineaceae bacterium]|nr:hypothetical protein [Anaerolineaceae bacterium]
MCASSSEYAAVICPQCGGSIASFAETIICPYCGVHLIRKSPTAPGASADIQGQVVQGMRFTTYTCMDNQGTGLEAFRMLIPVGWQVQGGVQWISGNPSMPAVLSFKASNPNGVEAFEAFPNQPFYWSSDPMTRMTFPVGSYYYGNEVRAPLNAQQTLRQLILPRFRSVPGLEVIAEEHLPDLISQVRTTPQAAGPMSQTSADGAKLRVRYAAQGFPVEEELYGVVEYQRMGMPAMFGVIEMVYWMADYMFSFTARAGQLDGLKDLFTTMLTSFKLNPQWFARFSQISQYLAQNQIQQINNIGQLSQYLSQVNNQISDTIISGYNQRQQVMERLSDRFSQSIRGVDAYYDPNSGYGVELPGGYQHAWSNSLGEYIVSNDAFFDPNQNSNLNWTPLQQQR